MTESSRQFKDLFDTKKQTRKKKKSGSMRQQRRAPLMRFPTLEKTLEAVGEDKEVVKLTDDQSKSAEKSVGPAAFPPQKTPAIQSATLLPLLT